jgi:hypothetical protein
MAVALHQAREVDLVTPRLFLPAQGPDELIWRGLTSSFVGVSHICELHRVEVTAILNLCISTGTPTADKTTSLTLHAEVNHTSIGGSESMLITNVQPHRSCTKQQLTRL